MKASKFNQELEFHTSPGGGSVSKKRRYKMSDEKKTANEEITEEQANEAVGGVGTDNNYKCEGGCGRSYWGIVKYRVNGKPYCANCYAKYQQSKPVGRP